MSNHITSVEIPDKVQSGKEFDVTVNYAADQGGDLAIAYTGSFDGTPPSVPLDGNKTSQPFKMTIVRSGAAPLCRVEFRFGNLWPSLVEVT